MASSFCKRIGQVQMLDRMRQRPQADRRDQRIGHPFGDLIHFRARRRITEFPFAAGFGGEELPRGIEPHNALLAIDHLQPPADVHRGRLQHLSRLDDRKLGGAAADIDVEYAPASP